MSTDDTNGSAFEALPREECLELLASQQIGRVAVAEFNAAPLVVPVNFAVDGDRVVFRTDAGTKFSLAVLREQPVSFEVDGIDPGRRSGWSVLIQGEAVEMDPADVRSRLAEPWAAGRKEHWVQIVPVTISGRRIRLTGTGTDPRGYL